MITKHYLTVFLPLLFLIACAPDGAAQGTTDTEGENAMKDLLNNRLSPMEFTVIENKGTERAFTGEYWDHFETGEYVCARCGALLYESSTKFASQCGWPSFDDEVEGAVTRQTDDDGRRTEILCSTCGAHLGHVFEGEGYTEKNTRHCVNSLSIDFIPDQGETGRAYFAGGCFWGVEHFFMNREGVEATTVGYMGGSKAFPTYQEVSGHKTGHLETMEVIYDPAVVTFEELAKLFFEIHDPTQANGQGPDIGPQYLSAVFALNQSQRETTEKLIGQLKEHGYDVVTEIRGKAPFWPAEDYHQEYYDKKNGTPYCHGYVKRF